MQRIKCLAQRCNADSASGEAQTATPRSHVLINRGSYMSAPLVADIEDLTQVLLLLQI